MQVTIMYQADGIASKKSHSDQPYDVWRLYSHREGDDDDDDDEVVRGERG